MRIIFGVWIASHFSNCRLVQRLKVPMIRRFFHPRTETDGTLSGLPRALPTASSLVEVTEAHPSKRTRTAADSLLELDEFSTVPKNPPLLREEDFALARSERLSEWTHESGLLCKFSSSRSSSFERIMCFDLDHTLIKPKSANRKFSADADDWQFWQSDIPRRLRELHAQGVALVVFSNQQGLESGANAQTRQEDFKRKVDNVVRTLGVPVDILAATRDNRFRKPLPTMFEFFIAARCSGVYEAADVSVRAAFVGDAAGRPASGTRAKDFSDSDLKFARNIGIQFHTPERFFLRSTQRLHSDFPEALGGRRLCDLVPQSSSAGAAADTAADTVADTAVTWERPQRAQLEILLLVAPPAAGKSTLARRLTDGGADSAQSYVRVNRDELGSMPRCLQLARESLLKGHSVVVDNTNMRRDGRAPWVSLARELTAERGEEVRVRCLVLQADKERVLLLSKYRTCAPNTPSEDDRIIEPLVIHSVFKQQQPAALSEGFSHIDIVDVPLFVPDDPVSRRLFSLYLH